MKKNAQEGPIRRTLAAVAVAACFATPGALANPTGPTVVHGTAAIHQAGNLLQITNSPNAIINWQSFSIGASEITRFIQQSASSAVLNRVTTQNPSTILGALESNGRVFLINPNGILFGAGAQIDVAGLVASTLNMSDGDFLAGRMRFTDGLGKSVVNDGSITTGAGGSVYLIGSGVANNGIITSPQGEVVLAAGNSVELVSPGTPNLRVEIVATDNEARNLGQIISEAGRIGIYAGLISHSGTIRADSAVSEGGRILLKATKNTTLEAGSVTSASGTAGGSVTVQSGDTTLVSGTVEATGSEGNGGRIELLGERVGLINQARADASGKTGGGTVLVGGDYQGSNPEVQNAERTYVGPDVEIRADALESGDGGRVIVWADDVTRYYGSISARGGADGGDGGFAEVSGYNSLIFSGKADLSSAHGKAGTLLLDPNNIDIVNGGVATLGAAPGNGAPVATYAFAENAAGDSSIDADAITLLTNAGTNVNLQAHTDITVNEAITSTGAGALTLRAGDDVFVNQAITIGAGGVTIIAGDAGGTPSGVNNDAGRNIVVNAAITTLGTVTSGTASGSISLTATDAITLNANITTGTATVADTAAGNVARSGNISLTAGTGISGAGVLTTGAASLTGASAGGVDTVTSGNITLNVTGAGAVGLSAANALTIGAATSANPTTVTTTTGNITVTSADRVNNGTPGSALDVSFGTASGGSANNAGSLAITTDGGAAGEIQITSGEALRLGIIASGGGTQNISTTGANTLLTAAGNISSTGGNISLAATGGVTVNTGVTANSGTGTLLVNADSDGAGAGTLTLTGTGTLTSANTTANAVTLRAEDIVLSGTSVVSATGGTAAGINVYSTQAAQTMNIGGAAGSATGINLVDAELARFTNFVTLTLGESTVQSGVVTVTTATSPVPAGNIVINSNSGAGNVALAGMTMGGSGNLTVNAGTGGVTVSANTSNVSGSISLLSANGVTVNTGVTANSGTGTLLVNADSDGAGAGTLTLTGTGTLTSANTTANAVTLRAEDIVLSGTSVVRATGGTAAGINVYSTQAAQTMNISGAAGSATGINLVDAELARFTNFVTLTLGESTVQSGVVTVTTATSPVPAGNIVINSNSGAGGIVLADAGAATALATGGAGALTLRAGTGGITAASATNAIAELSTTGTVTLTSDGVVGSSTNRIQFPAAQDDVNVTTSGAGDNIFLNGLGALTLGSITAAANLDVTSAGAIAQSAAMSVTGTSSFNAGGNPITLTQANDFTGAVSANNVGANAIQLTDTNAIQLGTISTANNLTVNAVTGITQDAGGLTVGGTLTLTTTDASATLNTATNAITNLGATALGTGALNLLDAGGLTVTGAAGATGGITLNTSGALAVNNTLNAGVGNIALTTTGAGNAITQNATGVITAGTLTLTTTDASATLNTATNAITNLGATALGTGALNLLDAGGLTVTGAVGATGGITLNTSGALAVNNTLNAGAGNVLLTSTTGAISDTGAINANLLTTSSAGGTVLDFGHTVTGFNATNITSGNIELTNTAATLTIAGINNTAAAGTVQVVNTGDLVLQAVTGSVTTAPAVGGDIVLAAQGGNFINNYGSTALSPGGGRWLVYSTDPANDVRGGLAYDFKQYNATYGVTIVAGSGNGFLYTLAPTITPVLQGVVTKTYDGFLAATLAAGNYQATGIGEIDGDTVVLSNPATGVYATAHVGSPILVTASSASTVASATNGAATVYGYQVSAAPASGNVGSITARALTGSATITPVAKTYDGFTAATGSTIAGTTAGTVNGDAVALNTSGYVLDHGSAHAGATTVSATGNAALGAITSNPAGAQDGSAGNPVVALAGDYTLTLPATVTNQGVASSITARALTGSATITPVAKTYDGFTAATGSTIAGTTAGTVNGDAVALNTSGYVLDHGSAHAGATTVSATGNAALGAITSNPAGAQDGSAGNPVVALAGDYTLTLPATVTNQGVASSITARALTGSATITPVAKTYDGFTAATGSTIAGTTAGTVNGDAVALNTSGYVLDHGSAHAGATTVSATGNAALGAITSNPAGAQDGSAGNPVVALAGDYTLTLPATVTNQGVASSITARALTGSATITPVAKTYDGFTAATGSTIAGTTAGTVNGDAVALNTSGYVLDHGSAHAGATTVSATGNAALGAITSNPAGAQDGSAGNPVVALAGDYTLTLPATVTNQGVASSITARALTGSATITPVAKTYDGFTAATGSTIAGTTAGTVNGDAVALNTSGYVLDHGSAHAGATTVSATGNAALGAITSNPAGAQDGSAGNPVVALAGDYTLTLPATVTNQGVASSITARALTGSATITPVAKTYDGFTAATGSTIAGTTAGTVNGDAVALNTSGYVLDHGSAHAGATTVSATGNAALGAITSNPAGAQDGSAGNPVVALAGDYTLTLPATVTNQGVASSITARALTGSATITPVAKTYDGFTAATGSTIAGTTAGTVNGDAVALNTSGYVLDHGSAHAGATTVSATGNAALGAITSNPAGAQDGSAGNPVVALAGDYTLTLPATVTNQGVASSITARALTGSATITPVAKTYDGFTAATGSTIAGTTAGTVNGDAVALNTSGYVLDHGSAHAGATTVSATGNAALGAITSNPAGAQDGSAGNPVVALAGDYTLTLPATVTNQGVASSITARALTGSATITPVAKTYDGFTAATGSTIAGTTAGTVNGDAVALNTSGYVLDHGSAHAGATTVSATGNAALGAITSNPAGAQDGSAGNPVVALAGDYTLTLPATVTNQGVASSITAKTVDLAGTRAYDATANFTAGGFTPTITGTVGGETLTIASGTGTVPVNGVAAGTQTLTTGTLALGNGTGLASDYTLSGGTHTGAITPTALSITADDKSRLQGTPNPPFTATYGGFQGGDTPASLTGTLSYSTTATIPSPVGSYPITPFGPSSTNYAISYIDGTLTVSAAILSPQAGQSLTDPVVASLGQLGIAEPYAKTADCTPDHATIGAPGACGDVSVVIAVSRRPRGGIRVGPDGEISLVPGLRLQVAPAVDMGALRGAPLQNPPAVETTPQPGVGLQITPILTNQP